MRYLLNGNIALRSWKGIPYGACVRYRDDALCFSKNQFDILIRCDGEHDFEEAEVGGDVFQTLLKADIVKPASPGEKLEERQRLRRYSHPYLGVIDLRITGRCNFNCRHCFNAADENHDLSEWTMPELCRLFDEAADYGIHSFRLTGGEPLLHPDLLRAVEEIQKRDMHVKSIITNAHFITPEFIRRLKEMDANPLFLISFDCLGHHDWMRRHEGAEQRALKAIRLCCENGFRVWLNVQLNKVTRDTLLETAEYFDALEGIDVFRIIRTTETPRWARLAGDACLSLSEYFDECVGFLKAYAEKHRKMIVMCWEFAVYYPFLKKYKIEALRCRSSEFRPDMPCCATMINRTAIGADGSLYPDHETSGFYDSIGKSFGNVKSDGLVNSLNNAEYQRLAHMTVGDLAENGAKCRACPHFLQCQGGCRAMARVVMNEEYGPDPAMCAFFEGDYAAKLNQALPGCDMMVRPEEHCEWTGVQEFRSAVHYFTSACDDAH